jgi:hypothetical protein
MVLAPLQFSGRSLTPDVLGGIQQGQQVSQGENILQQQKLGIQQTQQEQALAQQQTQQTAAAQQQAISLLERSRKGAPAGDINSEVIQLLFNNPEIGRELHTQLGADTEEKKLNAARVGFNIEQAAGNREAQDQILIENIKRVDARNGDSSHSRELLNMPEDRRIQAAKLMQVAALNREELANAIQGGAQGLASAKTLINPDGSTIQALPSGEVEVRNPTGDIVTDDARLAVLKQAADSQREQKEQDAERAIKQARGIAGATNREKRISAKKTEFADRIQGAAREGIRLNAALNAAAKADQGLTGTLKVQLAKVFPDIDVTNEATLDQALGQLTIDQLQKFKGPTTDFEFAKSQLTVGALGDSKTANVARLKALQRNSWFVKRESEQFNRHIKDGGDVDNFAFNFNELMKTKRGNFTLQQLQDTAADANISIEETIKRLN